MPVYDWIVMITLGLERWDTGPQHLAPHEKELEAARQRHEATAAQEPAAKPARQGFWARMFSRRVLRSLRSGPPRKQASRV